MMERGHPASVPFWKFADPPTRWDCMSVKGDVLRSLGLNVNGEVLGPVVEIKDADSLLQPSILWLHTLRILSLVHFTMGTCFSLESVDLYWGTSMEAAIAVTTRNNDQTEPPTMTRMSYRRAMNSSSAAQRTITISPISPRSARTAYDADQRIVTQLANIRGNRAAYIARYPAAVAVFTRLGAAMWKGLERYRYRTARFAALMRRMDREELTMGRDFLDEKYFSTMQDYVKENLGDLAEMVFVCHRHAIDSMLEEDAKVNVGVQESLCMTMARELFLRKPFMWFIYNFYFPVKGLRGEPGRMNWVQLKDWAIWALENPSEEPKFLRELSPEEFVPVKPVTDADLIYNAALIEVFTDVAARFAVVDGV